MTVPDSIALLLLQHPCVSDAVVLPVPDEVFGQRLRAFVTTHSGIALGEAELREYLLERFEMPRDILISSCPAEELDIEPPSAPAVGSNMTVLSEYRTRHARRRG